MASRKRKFKIPGLAWVVGFLVVLMIVAFAIIHFSQAQSYDYNAFHITKAACVGTARECYYVEFSIRDQPYTISFYNHPKDVENIPVMPSALQTVLAGQRIANHTVYIAVPENAPGQVGIAGVALARVLGTRYGIVNLNVKGATFGTKEGQVTCSSANQRTIVVSLQQEPLDGVALVSPNCVVIGATDAERIVATSEAFTYHILGVIPTFTAPQFNSTNDTLLR
jgi:hypothetical protein